MVGYQVILSVTWSTILLNILLLTMSACKLEKERPVFIQELIFLPEIHDNKVILTADSLHFCGKDSLALQIYIKTLQQNSIGPIKKHYIQSKIIQISEDSSIVRNLYDQLIISKNKINHYATCLQWSWYELNSGKTLQHIDKISQSLQDAKSNYFKGHAAYLLARYQYERKNNLDSAWYYLMVAKEAFEKTKMITPIYQECLELITSFCTYKRKNLLAIRYANLLFEFDRYLPQNDSVDIAKAYANRAFMMFREGDIQGTNLDIEMGLTYCKSENQPELYQNLMKSYLVKYMIEANDSMWHITANLINQNIQICGRDYIEMNRWYGQFYTQTNLYKKAIPYLKTALESEIKNGNTNSARHSTLCFLLSQCYENLGDYAEALVYMAKNEAFERYNTKSMMAHISVGKGYSFVTGLRCANIFFSQYKHTGQLSSLLQAKAYLDVLDEVMFGQFKVAEENAILQFYLESGQEFFHLGMDVHYELRKKTGNQKHLEIFINYSDKNKNSLMYRDIRMARRQTILSEEITNKEFKLRAAIKEEKRKGLRNNRNFNKLIDEYTALETEIELKHTVFITEGLIKDELKTDNLMEELPDDSTCILMLDETPNHWYYTLITRHGVFIEKETTSANLSQLSDTLLNIFQKANRHKDLTHNPWLSSLLPKNIRSGLTKRILYIPDGVYHRFPLDPILGDEKYAIIHLPTIRLMHKFLDDVSGNKDVALFAFSDVETIKSKTRTKLTELPGTYKEVMALAKKYPKAKIYTGKNATKANFIKAYQDTNIQYIHLALHGLANSAEKDDVKLYLRTKSGGLDSLYGYELMKYKSQCKKVVLSACQSGIGAYIRGEGNYSLPRYFMINGATNVVFNYWDVED